MARGRKPDPAALQDAKGNPGRRKAAPNSDQAGDVTPPPVKSTAPRYLKGTPLEIWNRIAPELVRMNLLRATDYNALAVYCQTVADYRAATGKLKNTSKVYWTDSNHGRLQRISPWFIVQQRLVKAMLDYEDRFGLNPAMRQRIQLQLAQTPAQLPLTSPEPDATPEQPRQGALGWLNPQGHA